MSRAISIASGCARAKVDIVTVVDTKPMFLSLPQTIFLPFHLPKGTTKHKTASSCLRLFQGNTEQCLLLLHYPSMLSYLAVVKRSLHLLFFFFVVAVFDSTKNLNLPWCQHSAADGTVLSPFPVNADVVQFLFKSNRISVLCLQVVGEFIEE